MVRLDRMTVCNMCGWPGQNSMVRLDRVILCSMCISSRLNKIIPSIRWAVFWRLEFLPHMTLSYQQLLLCSGPNCASYNYELLP